MYTRWKYKFGLVRRDQFLVSVRYAMPTFLKFLPLSKLSFCSLLEKTLFFILISIANLKYAYLLCGLSSTVSPT
jgi:hypothetical protein